MKTLNWNRVITYAGAFIALLIGSGFATGQEILQYFAAYGYQGILGLLFILILFFIIGTELIDTGYEGEMANPNDIYLRVCGPKIGQFYDYFSVFSSSYPILSWWRALKLRPWSNLRVRLISAGLF